jgi:hypothetical protein
MGSTTDLRGLTEEVISTPRFSGGGMPSAGTGG